MAKAGFALVSSQGWCPGWPYLGLVAGSVPMEAVELGNITIIVYRDIKVSLKFLFDINYHDTLLLIISVS